MRIMILAILLVLSTLCAHAKAPPEVLAVAASTGKVISSHGTGTGWCVRRTESRTYFITCAHVACSDAAVLIEHEGERIPAAVKAIDSADDLTLLEAEPLSVEPLTIDDDPAAIGDWIFVYGAPFGDNGIANWGRIASIAPKVLEADGMPQIVLDLPGIPGDSGSPVCRVGSGSVVGMLRIGREHIVGATPAAAILKFLKAQFGKGDPE